MKIAFLLPSLANKGPIIFCRDLVEILLEMDNTVKVDVFYFDPIIQVAFPCPTKQITFFTKIDFDQYDIVHSNMLRPDLYLAWHRKQIKGVALSTLHCYNKVDLGLTYNPLIADLGSRLWLYALSRLNHVVVLNKDMQQYYAKSLKKNTVIINGRRIRPAVIETEEAERIKAYFKGKVVFGVISLMIKRKGIDQLIHAIVANKDWALLLVGDGPEKPNLEALVKKLGIEHRCLFLGFRDEAHKFYQLMDVAVLPSHSEGTPLTLIEASYYGKASVCSNIGPLKAVFTEEETSFFELNNIASLEQALQESIIKRAVLETNTKRKYEREFTLEQMGQSYMELYRKLLDTTKNGK